MFIVSNKNITHVCDPNIVSNKNITHVCNPTPVLRSGRHEYIIQYTYTCLVNNNRIPGVFYCTICINMQSTCRLIDIIFLINCLSRPYKKWHTLFIY